MNDNETDQELEERVQALERERDEAREQASEARAQLANVQGQKTDFDAGARETPPVGRDPEYEHNDLIVALTARPVH